jgi:glycosyltransferase involved in cell wall biosynthesis
VNSLDPFISIVTVSLNAAATIADTIASVSLQQADFPIEMICVDGGSSDATRAIIDQWAARTHHISRIYEPDRGIFDAMNKGLGAARGEYLLFLNADDFLVAPDTLAKAMRGLTPGAPGNPDLVLGDAAMGRLAARGLWRHRRVPRLLGRVRGLGLYPVQQGQFTKRSLLRSVGGFDAQQRLAADVTQYYDLERRFRLTTRRLRSDVTFMRAGGAANAGLKAMYLGTTEIYRHLRPTHRQARALWMVMVKTMQSLSEVRYGRCPHRRWFV